MDRLLVALLSAFDAVIAAAVGVAAVLAPLTLVWVIGLGGEADWTALWPASGSIWLLGNLVPLSIELDDVYVAQAGIDVDATAFTLSLAPLAFAAFTAIFAARSGGRAAGAGAWITGVTTGALVYAAAAAAVVLTTANPVARPMPWQGILLPFLLYGIAALCGAIVTSWRSGDDGPIDRLRYRLEMLPHGWSLVPALIARGTAIAVAGLVAAASIAVAVAVIARGGEVIALYESTHLDALGATVVTLGQLTYLPTLIVWAMAWLAGPGIALGTSTAVSPAGTQLGVVPGIPALGLLPEEGSPWLLLVLLVPVAAGAISGWAIRSRMIAPRDVGVAATSPSALTGLLPPVHPDAEQPEHEHAAPRIAVTAGIGLFAGACAALLAWAASGSLGPSRLSEVGPAPGPVALVVGFEVLVGAGILLLGPATARPARQKRAAASPGEETRPVANARTFAIELFEPEPAGPEPAGPETDAAGPETDAAGPEAERAAREDAVSTAQREATIAQLHERLRVASHDEKPPVD